MSGVTHTTLTCRLRGAPVRSAGRGRQCLAAGMVAEEITAEYPTVTIADVPAAAALGAARAREEVLPPPQRR